MSSVDLRIYVHYIEVKIRLIRERILIAVLAVKGHANNTHTPVSKRGNWAEKGN